MLPSSGAQFDLRSLQCTYEVYRQCTIPKYTTCLIFQLPDLQTTHSLSRNPAVDNSRQYKQTTRGMYGVSNCGLISVKLTQECMLRRLGCHPPMPMPMPIDTIYATITTSGATSGRVTHPLIGQDISTPGLHFPGRAPLHLRTMYKNQKKKKKGGSTCLGHMPESPTGGLGPITSWPL